MTFLDQIRPKRSYGYVIKMDETKKKYSELVRSTLTDPEDILKWQKIQKHLGIKKGAEAIRALIRKFPLKEEHH